MASENVSAPVAESSAADQSGLRGFLNKGGVWRFLAFMLVYLIIYVGVGRITLLFARDLAEQPVLSSVSTVFIQLTLGLIVGAAILIATITYMGWTKQLFARQTIYRSWWMWLGPIVVAIPIVLRVLGIDWGRNAVPVVLLVMVTGLMIGFVEELMYRGIGVKMLRDGGHGEFAVAALTSLFFAISHSVNLLMGQSIASVGPTVAYTFAFGVLMYLTLRSVGFLVAAMIMHGLTDPTTILATGGIDEITEAGGDNVFLTATGAFTLVMVPAGVILLLFVRGRVQDRVESAS
ncbi:MAG: CPBP family intramembrane metalloprotease [Candidatus Nanopelagicales bacterium]|nr:CPBP family intramembrane metalloprotease [Candidatus Nanopelagicales bacterium]